MKDKVVVAVITGIFSLIVGVIGTLGASKVLNNQNVVTVNVNGQEVSVSQDEYEAMYSELKTNYDALITENQGLKDEVGALKEVGSKEPESKPTSAEKGDGAYIGEELSAYYQGMYYQEYSPIMGKTFHMGGKEYDSGFTMSGLTEYYACFNLEGDYTTLSGLAGNLDGENLGVIYGVYGDDTLLGTIEVKGAALPIEFSIDVTGVQQLKIAPTEKNIWATGYIVGFANVLLK